jgi:hypothetical protein
MRAVLNKSNYWIRFLDVYCVCRLLVWSERREFFLFIPFCLKTTQVAESWTFGQCKKVLGVLCKQAPEIQLVSGACDIGLEGVLCREIVETKLVVGLP